MWLILLDMPSEMSQYNSRLCVQIHFQRHSIITQLVTQTDAYRYTTASTKQRGHNIICFLCHHLGDSGMSGDPIKRQQARISCRPSDTLQPNDNPSTPIFTRAAIWQQYPCTYASCMVIIIYSTYVQQAILSIYTAYQISSNTCHWC